MGIRNVQLIDPRAPSAVFKAVVETQHHIADRAAFVAYEPDFTEHRIREQLVDDRLHSHFLKRHTPWIVALQPAHELEQHRRIGQFGLAAIDGHECNPLPECNSFVASPALPYAPWYFKCFSPERLCALIVP